jgi:hypothetical protein
MDKKQTTNTQSIQTQLKADDERDGEGMNGDHKATQTHTDIWFILDS